MDPKLLEIVTREVVRQLDLQSSSGSFSGSTEPAQGCSAQGCSTTVACSTTPDLGAFKIGISNRHLHLSRDHMDTLFGPGSRLTVLKELIQPGQFAAVETVTAVGPKGCLKGLRVVGPLRDQTQIEIAQTDAIGLGIQAPIRVSGDLAGSAPCVLVGPRGSVLLDEGVIVAKRHVHLEPDRALRLGLKDRAQVKVAFDGDRGGLLDQFVVRIGSGHFSEIHLDTDEANALGVRNLQEVRILK